MQKMILRLNEVKWRKYSVWCPERVTCPARSGPGNLGLHDTVGEGDDVCPGRDKVCGGCGICLHTFDGCHIRVCPNFCPLEQHVPPALSDTPYGKKTRTLTSKGTWGHTWALGETLPAAGGHLGPGDRHGPPSSGGSTERSLALHGVWI